MSGGAQGVHRARDVAPVDVHRGGGGPAELEQSYDWHRNRHHMEDRHRKGHLGVGADADFNLVDLNAEEMVRSERLHSRNPVSPYEGWRITGAVRATYLRGTLIAKDGEPTGSPTGAFVTSVAHRRAQLKGPGH